MVVPQANSGTRASPFGRLTSFGVDLSEVGSQHWVSSAGCRWLPGRREPISCTSSCIPLAPPWKTTASWQRIGRGLDRRASRADRARIHGVYGASARFLGTCELTSTASRPSHRWTPRTALVGAGVSARPSGDLLHRVPLVLPSARAQQHCRDLASPISRDHPLVGRIWMWPPVPSSSARSWNRIASHAVASCSSANNTTIPITIACRHGFFRHRSPPVDRPAVGFEMFSIDDAPAIAGHAGCVSRRRQRPGAGRRLVV